jgi:hypothetical protein
MMSYEASRLPGVNNSSVLAVPGPVNPLHNSNKHDILSECQGGALLTFLFSVL